MAQVARNVQKCPGSSGEGALGRVGPYSAIAREATVVNPARSKYTTGQYALCPNCLQRPCQCSTAAAVPAPILSDPGRYAPVPLCDVCGFKPCRCAAAAAAPATIGEVSHGQAVANNSPAPRPRPAGKVLPFEQRERRDIPYDIWDRWGKEYGLKANERWVLSAVGRKIAGWGAWDDGASIPISQLVDICALSARKVQLCLRVLEGKGVIRIEPEYDPAHPAVHCANRIWLLRRQGDRR